MSAESPLPNAAPDTILQQLSAQLDAVEAELKRLGWWSAQPPDLLAEVAAGRLKSFLDAPTFELWLQCVFLPNARTRVAEADLPETSSVGEMARRQYDFHSYVEEAQALLALLQRFDDLVGRFHRKEIPEMEPDEPTAPDTSPAAPEIVPQIAAMFSESRGLLLHWLDLAEDQLQRLGWWDDDPKNPPAGFGKWMRTTFVPEARASIGTGIVPATSDLAGEAARQLEADELSLPEALLSVLTNFDEGVASYHSTWKLCGLPPPVPVAGTPATPPAYTGELGERKKRRAAPRVRLAPAPVDPMGFEAVLDEARGLLGCLLESIETEINELPEDLPSPPGDGSESPVEEWLVEEFLPDVRAWLEKGDVPQESHVAAPAAEELAARRIQKHTKALLAYLRAFDNQVAAYHQLHTTLPFESAGARMAAAWRLVMATVEVRTPLAPEPDAIRRQMLLILNRIEAELHLLGWWCLLPLQMPAAFQNTIDFSGKHTRGVDPPRFELWLQAAFLPEMRERVQTSNFPDNSRIRDDANRALSEERLGKEKSAESRRLYRCFDELETLMLHAWPATMERHNAAKRRRGLTPPRRKSSAAFIAALDEVNEYRDDVAEALRLTSFELKSLGWCDGCDPVAVRALINDPGTLVSSDPPPFEHWLEAVFLPEARARLKDRRMLEERRVSDYVAWECRHLNQTTTAKDLLTQLEKVDHCSAMANRAEREMWDL